MTYPEEETVGLRHQRSQQAIALAMEGRWREAIGVNQNLIDGFPDDVSAHNRLGRAYMELGEFSRAWEAYSRAIELDPYNTIARKNLDRLSRLHEEGAATSDGSRVEPQNFIEETGKAGVVNLDHLGRPEVADKLVAGDQVYLKINGSNLIVEDGRGEYLGQVDLKHGQRLIKLIEGGNKYATAIVSSAADSVTVIIREVHQDPAQAGRLSFPARGLRSPRPYVSDRVARYELEYEETTEEEEEPGYPTVRAEESTISTVDATGFSDQNNEDTE